MSFDTDQAPDNQAETTAPPDRVGGAISDNAQDTFGRLHLTSIFFDVVSHIRTVLIPAIIAFFSAAQGSRWALPG